MKKWETFRQSWDDPVRWSSEVVAADNDKVKREKMVYFDRKNNEDKSAILYK